MDECLVGQKRVGEIATKDLDVKDDYHASGWYKKEMVQVMVRAIQRAMRNGQCKVKNAKEKQDHRSIGNHHRRIMVLLVHLIT
jgi:hypothetical protein